MFDHNLFSPPGWSVVTFPPLSISIISTIHTIYLQYIYLLYTYIRSHLVLATRLERDHLSTTVYIIYIYNIYIYYIHISDHILFSPPGWSVITFPPLSKPTVSTIRICTIDIYSITSFSCHLAGAWSPFHQCLYHTHTQYISIYYIRILPTINI